MSDEILPPGEMEQQGHAQLARVGLTASAEDLALMNQGLAIMGEPAERSSTTSRSKRRRRKKQAAKGWERKFLRAYAATGVRTTACRIAGVEISTMYKKRKRSAAFGKLFREADEVATDTLEAVAMARARSGESDTMTIFMLKARRPTIYRETVRTEHAVPAGEGGVEFTFTLKIGDAARLQPASELATGTAGHALTNGHGSHGKVIPILPQS